MPKIRTKYAPDFKLRVVMESFQRDTTIESVSRKFQVHSTMLHKWRNEFKKNGVNIFADKRNSKAKAVANGYKPGESPEELKRIIGDLTVQMEIIKKAEGLLD